MMDFSKNVIVFSHVPKSAGTSLDASFKKLLGSDACLRLRMQKIENVCTSRAHELAVLALEQGFRSVSSLTRRHYLLPRRATMRQVRQASYLSGHFRIGEEPQSDRQPHYLSVVREPVDRFLSFYYYRIDAFPISAKGKRHHPLLDRNGKLPATPLDYLEHLKRSGAQNWRDPQVRYFAADGTFESARSAIKENDVLVAPLTQYQVFLAALARRIGVDEVPMQHTNRGVARAKVRKPLSPKERAAIAAHFVEDQKLYDYVTARVARGALEAS